MTNKEAAKDLRALRERKNIGHYATLSIAIKVLERDPNAVVKVAPKPTVKKAEPKKACKCACKCAKPQAKKGRK